MKNRERDSGLTEARRVEGEARTKDIFCLFFSVTQNYQNNPKLTQNNQNQPNQKLPKSTESYPKVDPKLTQNNPKLSKQPKVNLKRSTLTQS